MAVCVRKSTGLGGKKPGIQFLLVKAKVDPGRVVPRESVLLCGVRARDSFGGSLEQTAMGNTNRKTELFYHQGSRPERPSSINC